MLRKCQQLLTDPLKKPVESDTFMFLKNLSWDKMQLCSAHSLTIRLEVERAWAQS